MQVSVKCEGTHGISRTVKCLSDPSNTLEGINWKQHSLWQRHQTFLRHNGAFEEDFRWSPHSARPTWTLHYKYTMWLSRCHPIRSCSFIRQRQPHTALSSDQESLGDNKAPNKLISSTQQDWVIRVISSSPRRLWWSQAALLLTCRLQLASTDWTTVQHGEKKIKNLLRPQAEAPTCWRLSLCEFKLIPAQKVSLWQQHQSSLLLINPTIMWRLV